MREQYSHLWETLKTGGTERVRRSQLVSAARRGDVEAVMPGVFPANWPKPVVSNIIDVTARDLAEMLARLPAVDCTSSNTTSDRSKKFASKRTNIALHYMEHSRFKLQMYSGCDWFWSYGAMPVICEPDFDKKTIRMRVDNPMSAYWSTDFYGTVKTYAKSWTDTGINLASKFPEFKEYILKPRRDAMGVIRDNADSPFEVVQMYYGNKVCLFLPEVSGLPDSGESCLVLNEYTHRLDRPPVVVAERPMWDSENRGQFDDVLWVWLARARMGVYGLEAADKAIRAPLAVPDDVDQITFGADAVIRTNEPDKVRRVGIELPNSAMIETQALDQEIADGARVPSARRGNVNASVITGRGVEALTSVFETQLATAQDIVGDTIRRLLNMCFEMDEKYWGEVTKTVTGTANGAPFTERYTPSKDIKGDYTATVTYGMTAGMDPNRAMVFLLQARADALIPRDTVQRMLPFEVDVEQLQRQVDIEQIEDALKQGLYALLASAPSMPPGSGVDPVTALTQAAEVIKARERGVPIHTAILDAFKPDEEAAAAPADPMAALMEQMGGGSMGGGGTMAAQGGAGAPMDLNSLLSGLTAPATTQATASAAPTM